MDNRTILTVSELNSSIRTLLEGRFPFISVCGEISNLHKPYSGHLYFTLKDSTAGIKAVLFKMQQRYLSQQPKDGMHVVCRGRISVYEPRGEYQLIVDTVDPQGAGALQQAFEQLKQRLAAEGLFDEHLKRPTPRIPRHVTLITSPQGAAVHDFIRIATRRYPSLTIAVYPVAVQGDQAPAEMVKAIADINAKVHTDVIVLCRGGGSFEDLQAYNNEQLARAIRASAIPVVSAVGHEIDFTIADFAADLRAPTPSAAAELLTPDAFILRNTIQQHAETLSRRMLAITREREHRLHLARYHLLELPRAIDNLLLIVDHLSLQLHHAFQTTLSQRAHRLATGARSLERCNPALRLAHYERQLDSLGTGLVDAMRNELERQEKRLTRTAGVLHAVSPLATMERGYAIVRKTTAKQSVITDKNQVVAGESVDILLRHGRLHCVVDSAGDWDSA